MDDAETLVASTGKQSIAKQALCTVKMGTFSMQPAQFIDRKLHS